MSDLGLNPRWVNYCRANGRSPEDQIDHDRQQYPGGSMCGFVLWNGERLREANKEHPEFFTFGGLVDHEGYDAWLSGRVDQLVGGAA